MDIKMIVMDWAGTTVDYGCFAPVHAFAKAFEEVGITPTMQEIREPMGLLKMDHIRAMLSMNVYKKPGSQNINRHRQQTMWKRSTISLKNNCCPVW